MKTLLIKAVATLQQRMLEADKLECVSRHINKLTYLAEHQRHLDLSLITTLVMMKIHIGG